MTSMETLSGRRDFNGGYKVDVSRGERVGRVSSEWFSRPADERFLSLSELFASVRGRAERSRTQTVESAATGRAAARFDGLERIVRTACCSDGRVRCGDLPRCSGSYGRGCGSERP